MTTHGEFNWNELQTRNANTAIAFYQETTGWQFRAKEFKMSDLQKYIAKRKARDPEFAKDYERGYKEFKIGVMLKMASEEAGLTQEEPAEKLQTEKSAISCIENHAKDIKLSTLENSVQALGKKLRLEVA